MNMHKYIDSIHTCRDYIHKYIDMLCIFMRIYALINGYELPNNTSLVLCCIFGWYLRILIQITQ